MALSELNRPLGKKEPAAEEPAQSRLPSPMGLASLLVALVALAVAVWAVATDTAPDGSQMARKDVDSIAQRSTPSESTASAETQEPANVPSTQSTGTRDAGGGIESGGENGLQALVPDGTIAVPKPRPPRADPQPAGEADRPDPALLEEGATGVIPKRAEDGRRPMDVYARQPNTTGNFGVARVVLIMGGMGISQTNTQLAIDRLPPSVTLAFAPYGNSLNRWMKAARQAGHELLLQIPMEPFGYPQQTAGPHTLATSADPIENITHLHWAMSRITNYVGLMNYQGAKMLADPDALKPVFDEIAERGLLFVDDGSASGSRSREAASASILPFAQAHLVIDAVRSRKAIAEQFAALVDEAKRTGIAIGVANGFEETITMMAEFAGQASALGVEITPVSAIVSDPERN